MITNPYSPPGAAVQDVLVTGPTGELAERGTRLVASILDGIILVGMVYLPLMLTLGMADSAANEPTAAVVAVVAGVATVVGLIAWCWLTIKYVVRNGQSIAKKMMHIKVVRSDGSPASLARIFWLRNVVNALLGIIPLYGIIDHLFIFGESRQCLHDKLADTIVVQD